MHKCKNILIAEDNDDIRNTIQDVLLSEGYPVETASNGKMALEKLRKMPAPSLVLLDLMMPVMSGWEFLDAQKADPELASHAVVVLSAVRATESLNDPTPLDTADAICKPVTFEKLLDTVREYLETESVA